MKAVILSGGFGTRIAEETHNRPKPMIEIGGKPILWHIMKIYSYYGVNDFIICCGYKGNIIKEYFSNYSILSSDITYDLQKNSIKVHKKNAEPWKVTVVDTGEATMTGGRIKKIQNYLKNEKNFCVTYGDGVSDINIKKSIEFHLKQKKIATIAAVHPPSRFGALEIKQNLISKFVEKPAGDNTFINGGFFVFSHKIFESIKYSNSILEKDVLPLLARKKQLSSFKHTGFWQPMDTIRDKNLLEALIDSNSAPWVKWK